MDQEAQAATCEHLSWQTVPREQLNPLLARQVVSGKRAMIAQVYLKKGAIVPAHSHESEQLSYVIEGAMQFQVQQQGSQRFVEIVVRAGEILVIPSHVVHSAVALEDTVDLDVFSPIREDWLNGTDAYLRG